MRTHAHCARLPSRLSASAGDIRRRCDQRRERPRRPEVVLPGALYRNAHTVHTQYTQSTHRVHHTPHVVLPRRVVLRCVTNSNATCRTALQRRPLLPRVALPRGRAALHDYAAWHVACRMPRVVSVALRRSSVVLGWVDAARHIACRVLCAGRAGGRQAVHIDGGGAPHYPHSLASLGTQ